MASLKPVLAQLASGVTLAADEAETAFGIIMSGEATPAQIAGLLMAMRVRRKTAAELTGAVRAMRVNVDVALHRLPDVLKAAGCAFLFAPRHHAALRHVAGPHVELGTRTIFNLLGPLANPAGVRRQLTGVHDPAWLRPMAETLHALGTERAWLVHGHGLDELTLAGPSRVVALHDGTYQEFSVVPEDAGLERSPIEAIRGGDDATNAGALQALLHGALGPYRDTVLLNAAAGLIVAGAAHDLRSGALRAAAAIDGGSAANALDRLRRATV